VAEPIIDPPVTRPLRSHAQLPQATLTPRASRVVERETGAEVAYFKQIPLSSGRIVDLTPI
jgi:hypothetical protein